MDIKKTCADLLPANPEAALAMALMQVERLEAKADRPEGVQYDSGRFRIHDLDGLRKVADFVAASGAVPAQFDKQPDKCMVAVHLSQLLDVDVFAMCRSLYFYSGRIGLEGQMFIALLNRSEHVKGRVTFETTGEGDELRVVAKATDSEGNECRGECSKRLAVKNGWAESADGMPSQWETMTEQRCKYRAAAFLARAHFPDVVMGLCTADELDDIRRTEQSRGGQRRPKVNGSATVKPRDNSPPNDTEPVSADWLDRLGESTVVVPDIPVQDGLPEPPAEGSAKPKENPNGQKPEAEPQPEPQGVSTAPKPRQTEHSEADKAIRQIGRMTSERMVSGMLQRAEVNDAISDDELPRIREAAESKLAELRAKQEAA